MFPEMLRVHVENSKLKLPDDFENYDIKDYPQFHVFLATHCCCSIEVESIESNANIIAKISDKEIQKITMKDLINYGVFFPRGNDIV
jgi:hypothetical protein